MGAATGFDLRVTVGEYRQELVQEALRMREMLNSIGPVRPRVGRQGTHELIRKALLPLEGCLHDSDDSDLDLLFRARGSYNTGALVE